MIKVKICGITRLEDAIVASQSGAWAVGFIFVKESARYISPENAFGIIFEIPISLEKVGVFANFSVEEVVEYAKISKITKIQLHGGESAEFCKEVATLTQLPVIKAIRVQNIEDIKIISEYENIVEAVLLDSYSKSELGGTGEVFDWDVAVSAVKYGFPIILAGGLNPENIVDAYKQVKPFALDISSGVEQSKGIKDSNKLSRLFENLNAIL